MKKLFVALALLAIPMVSHAEEQKGKEISLRLPQKTFDAAVNALAPAYCSPNLIDRLHRTIDVVKQCYNDTDALTSANDICVFEDMLLKAMADTYRYNSEQMGDDDPTAGIKFITDVSIANRTYYRTRYFYDYALHRANLDVDQRIHLQIHYFDDRLDELIDVLNATCKKLRQ